MSNKKCPKNSIEKFQKLFKSVPKTGKKVSQIRETITKWSQTAPDGRWGLKNGLFPWVFAGCCRGCLPFRNFPHIISFFKASHIFLFVGFRCLDQESSHCKKQKQHPFGKPVSTKTVEKFPLTPRALFLEQKLELCLREWSLLCVGLVWSG